MRSRWILLLLLLLVAPGLLAARPTPPPTEPAASQLHVIDSSVAATLRIDPGSGKQLGSYPCAVQVFDGPAGTHWFLRQDRDTLRLWTESFGGGPCDQARLAYHDAAAVIGRVDLDLTGTRIAFSVGRDVLVGTDPETGDDVHRFEYLLLVGDVSATGEVTVTAELPVPDYGPSEVSWDRTSTQLAYTATPPGHEVPDIFVVSAAGGSPWNVTNSPSVGEHQPDFSPTADEIAYVKRTSVSGNYRNDIFVLDLTKGTTRQVTTRTNANVAQISAPAWSPDTRDLAFAAITSKTGTYDVHRIAASGSAKAVQLTSSLNSIMRPMWTR
jgi:hypothetical protein